MGAFSHFRRCAVIGQAPGPSDVYAEMILASGDVGISVDGTLPEYTR